MTARTCVMPRTAEFMRAKGYSEREIRSITYLSARECGRCALLDALRRQRSQGPRENGRGGAATEGPML